jgi:uncharacterized membrane protein
MLILIRILFFSKFKNYFVIYAVCKIRKISGMLYKMMKFEINAIQKIEHLSIKY